MISPLSYMARIVDGNKVITSEFHRWLQAMRRAIGGPFIGGSSPGSFTILGTEYGILVKRLELGAGERATVGGDARLVICG